MNAADNLNPHVLVKISDDVPEEQHDAIRSSVAVMASQSAEQTRQAVERNRVDTKRTKRLSGPLKDLVMTDEDAADAFKEETDSVDAAVELPPPPEWPPVTIIEGEPEGVVDAPPQTHVAPWHFQWQWHAGDPPSTSKQDRPNGRIELWTHADQNHNWSDCHGGFGIALTSNRVVAAAGRSLRRTNHRYYVHGGSFGGNATVEGGCEMTAIEGGRVLSAARDKRFRHRVSGGERYRWDEPGYETGDAIQVDWIMQPGRTYTFNVGCWVFGEAHGGLGTASIGSVSIYGQIITLNVFLTD